AQYCAERFRESHATGYLLSIDLSQAKPFRQLEWVRRFEYQLSDALAEGATGADTPVYFSVAEEHPDLEAIINLRHSDALAVAAVAVRYGIKSNDSHLVSRRWQMLMSQSHHDGRLKLIPHMSLNPISGLHALETGDCVMPTGLFEAGTDTAWLMLELNASRLVDDVRPRETLAACLRFADNLIDAIDWPRPVLQLDALLNRRVCLHVTGIGDMLLHRGMRPDSIKTFTWLKRWLSFVRRSLLRESRLLAELRGPFPELGANELMEELALRYGTENARQLLKNSFLRHRHVLALSPFSLFPQTTTSHDDGRWLGLVSTLECADALTMYGPDPRQRLSRDDWQRLLQLTGALARSNVVITGNSSVSRFA
ncbi:MAG: hypothetical protein ACR2QG_11925, partial [Gammaproteobacteria bacterium]